ncbi:hypothetical protein RB195_009243 [Necator americanus]|uniref:Uncharacterized protein n=1 Tax=Necator americanus TaxID=51031 RepID=A0ABR1CTP7_NECAM
MNGARPVKVTVQPLVLAKVMSISSLVARGDKNMRHLAPSAHGSETGSGGGGDDDDYDDEFFRENADEKKPDMEPKSGSCSC